MIDLRPIIASDVARSVIAYFATVGADKDLSPDEMKRDLTKLVFEHLQPKAVPFFPPYHHGLCSPDPDTIEAFLEKYPELRSFITEAIREALAIDPDAKFFLQIVRDPEGCGVCHENQHMSLGIIWSVVDEDNLSTDLREKFESVMIDKHWPSDVQSLIFFS